MTSRTQRLRNRRLRGWGSLLGRGAYTQTAYHFANALTLTSSSSSSSSSSSCSMIWYVLSLKTTRRRKKDNKNFLLGMKKTNHTYKKKLTKNLAKILQKKVTIFFQGWGRWFFPTKKNLLKKKCIQHFFHNFFTIHVSSIHTYIHT